MTWYIIWWCDASARSVSRLRKEILFVEESCVMRSKVLECEWTLSLENMPGKKLQTALSSFSFLLLLEEEKAEKYHSVEWRPSQMATHGSNVTGPSDLLPPSRTPLVSLLLWNQTWSTGEFGNIWANSLPFNYKLEWSPKTKFWRRKINAAYDTIGPTVQ